MRSFADRVKTAVENAEQGAQTAAALRYRTVLNELADGLAELGIGARIHEGRDPRKLGLYLHAPYRPHRGSLMVTFFLDGDKVVVSGETPKTLETPEELERWLLDFVQLPPFVESIRTLREEEAHPVEARLRVASGVAYAKGDVVVAVAAADQKMLAGAAVGTEVTLTVARVEFPGNATFADPPEYEILDSAGLVVHVDHAARAGDNLALKGRRAASA